MLAGGNEVNYLMINGDVFESSKAWPKFYKFKNYSSPLKWYKLQIDNNNNVTLVDDTVSAHGHIYFGVNMDKAIVYKTIKYNGEEYALVNCVISIYQPNHNVNGGWELSDALHTAAWFKMSNLGVGTPIVENGGGK